MKLLLPLLMLGGAGFSLPTLAADLTVAHDELLRRTAISVAGFWDELQAVNCVETVDQQKLNPNGKPMFRQQTDFDYIAILQLTLIPCYLRCWFLPSRSWCTSSAGSPGRDLRPGPRMSSRWPGDNGTGF